MLSAEINAVVLHDGSGAALRGSLCGLCNSGLPASSWGPDDSVRGGEPSMMVVIMDTDS